MVQLGLRSGSLVPSFVGECNWLEESGVRLNKTFRGACIGATLSLLDGVFEAAKRNIFVSPNPSPRVY